MCKDIDKQILINYLRVQTYETVTDLLDIIVQYPILQEQLGLLQAPRLSERDTVRLLQYINTNPTQLHLLHFTTVANTVGDYGGVKQGTSDEVYKEFIVICRNTTCSAGVFPVAGRCKATSHKNKGRYIIQSSVYLK